MASPRSQRSEQARRPDGGTERRAYRLAEMAQQLGVHPETLRRAAMRGDVPARKLGRQWLFRPEAVDGWLNDNGDHDAEPQDGRRRQRLSPREDRTSAFGPVTWLRNAEVLEMLFGWFGRIGPIGRRSTSPALCRDCASACDPTACVDCPECVLVGNERELALELRRPLAGLAEVRGAGWSDAAFILLALAGVTFDGLQETAAWVALNRAVEDVLAAFLPTHVVFALSGPLGLLVVWATFLLVFAIASTLTRALAGVSIGLAHTAGRYAATLLPIAAGYVVAHYLTLLIQGVASLPGMLLSPLAIEAELNWLPAGFVWYLSVGAIVAGHVAAVLLAHREALRLRARHPALAELPLVGLMLGYTVLSLWLIAQPITIEAR